jgi:hypothetical protein
MPHTDVQSVVSSSNLHCPTSTEQELTQKVVNLNAIIKQCAERLLPLLGPNIRLKCFFAEGLFPVQIESSQINEIVRDLFASARNRIGTTDGVLAMQTNNFILEQNSRRYAVVTVVSQEEAAVADMETKPRNTVVANLGVIDRIVKDNGGFIVDVPSTPDELKLYFPAIAD